MDVEQIKKRLDFAEGSFRTILTGGKVKLHRDQDEWLENQLNRLFSKDYIPSPATHYIYYDDEPAPVAVNTLHPMPHKLRANRLEIIEQLGEDNEVVDILGSAIRNKAGNYQFTVPSSYKGFICPRGDMYAAHEMICILQAKLEAYEAGRLDDPILKKPLVINNPTDRFYHLESSLEAMRASSRKDTVDIEALRDIVEAPYWESLIDALGVTNSGNFFKDRLNVHVTSSRHEAVALIKEKLPHELHVPPPPPNGSHIEPGMNLFFHTGTLEKIIFHMEGFRGTSAIIRPLHLTGEIAESPEEKARTAEGNALSKHVQAQLAASKVSDELLLKRFKVSRDKSATFVDDTFGYFVDRRMLRHFNLEGLEHLVDREEWLAKGYPFPHVEIGPVINACNGNLNFCNRVNEAFDKLEEAVAQERKLLALQGKPQRAINDLCPPVDRTFVEGSVIIYQEFPPYHFGLSPADFSDFLRELDQCGTDKEKQERIQREIDKSGHPLSVVTGSQRFYFNDQPLPPGIEPALIKTYNYQIPIGLPEGMMKSRAQLQEEGDMSFEPQRKADQALFYELGGDITKKVRKGFDLGEDRFNIVISSPEGPEQNRDTWTDLVLKLGDDRYFTRTLRGRLGSMEEADHKLIKDADGILIMPDPVPADDLVALAEKKFRFWSTIVAKQTDPRDMNKPIVFFDPDGTWKEEIEEYKYLYSLGGLKEKPEYIFRVATTPEEVAHHFNHARENRYPPVQMEEKERPEMQIPQSGKFNVAIFCSASFENEAMLRTTYNLSYNLAQSGFGLVYGGGSRYMMGMVYEGANAARAAGVNDVFVAGSNTPHLVLREGKAPEGLSDYYDAPNIYKRMEYMFKTADCCVIAPGGPGTMQELAGFVYYLASNFEQAKGKEMVIVNRPVTLSKGNGNVETVNYFDLLMRFIPEEKRKELNIHVVDAMPGEKISIEEKTKKVVEEIRARSEKAQDLVYHRRDEFKDAWAEKIRRGSEGPSKALPI